jgi:hypothetical protein
MPLGVVVVGIVIGKSRFIEPSVSWRGSISPFNGDIGVDTNGVVAMGPKANGRDDGEGRLLLVDLAGAYRSTRLASAWALPWLLLALLTGVTSLSTAKGS